MTIKSLPAFLLIAFGLAWSILVPYVISPNKMAAMFGPISGHHPLFILAVYSPAIAASIVVLYAGGLNGLKRYLSRLLLWRCSIAWTIFLVLGIPIIYMTGSAIKGNLFENPFPFPSVVSMFSAMTFMLVLGPVEELGWRGVALPLLQRQFAPIWAGLILGLVWGVWHLPAFFLSGTPQSAWQFTPFFIGSIAVSIILTPLFNHSGGSILLAALFHFQLNNPLWPDAQPYDIVFFVLAAILATWLNRKKMFDKTNTVMEVIPQQK